MPPSFFVHRLCKDKFAVKERMSALSAGLSIMLHQVMYDTVPLVVDRHP